MELRQGHLFIAINVYRYVYFNTCLFFHWLTIPPAAVHPPEPRSPGTGPCRWSPSRCSTWTRRKPWLMTGEPSAHTSSLSLWSSTKEKQKKNLSRPLPRWILCKYNRNHDQKVQRFLFFTHIYWKYFDYINHVFSKQKFYEIINVGLALFLTLFWMLTYLEESSAGNKLMPASFMIWEIIVNTLVKLNSQLLKVLKIGKKDL